ncbi:S1C family serine protease [Cohnella sp. GbtcB17]|uniref:S1C family serine protease n=1 Tax=Cohnella sp. GbtcB17 TaxID=2824762 RepID=UPI0020C6E920|nr:trypsin-like peptidase domain-containing protein [Cohnella sp. GbtcB17]
MYKKVNGKAAIGAAFFSFGLLLAGSATAAAPVSGSVSLPVKVINGEAYVKATSLTAALGGTGAYDKASQTYKYTPADVPSVIKQVAPSVVAIIGKPDAAGGRFELAHGTGVIIKEDGLIVTNAHVVQDMTRIVVVTADGKEYEGTRKQIDVTSDLALVQIKASGLKPAKFAASPLKVTVGEPAIAIGTPVSFSLRNTATVGVVSGLNRSISDDYNLLQTDAVINPGNSGGPLVNMKGEVVGINSMKLEDVDIDSMGFAIPADTVQYVLNQFAKYGKVMRPSLGLELEESWSAVVGLPTEEPMTVTSVVSAEAQAAGFKVGDQIYAVGGKQIATLVELSELLKSYLPGGKIAVTVLADGDLVSRQVVLSKSLSQ